MLISLWQNCWGLMPFLWLANSNTGPGLGEEHEFSFGLVGFEVSLRCPCGYKGLELGI